MPASPRHGPIADGGRSTTTPSSSSRSAEPQADDAARLPCLATGTPAPATTSAAIVEMLTVLAPVAAGAAGVDHPARAPRPRPPRRASPRRGPATSSGVSPLARSATTNPATWAGVASPDHDLAHRPGGVAGDRSVRRAGRRAAAARSAQRHPASRRAASRRSADRAADRQSRLAPAQQLDRGRGQLGRRRSAAGTTASASDQVASQASSRRAMSTSTGGQSRTSSLSCLAQPQPAGRPGLAVEDRRGRRRRRRRSRRPWHRCRPRPTRPGRGRRTGDDRRRSARCAPHRGVVAVDQHPVHPHRGLGGRRVRRRVAGRGRRGRGSRGRGVAHAGQPSRGGSAPVRARRTRPRRRPAAGPARPSASAPGEADSAVSTCVRQARTAYGGPSQHGAAA